MVPPPIQLNGTHQIQPRHARQAVPIFCKQKEQNSTACSYLRYQSYKDMQSLASNTLAKTRTAIAQNGRSQDSLTRQNTHKNQHTFVSTFQSNRLSWGSLNSTIEVYLESF